MGSRSVFGAVLLATALLAAAPAGAAAAAVSDCDTVVVDGARMLGGSREVTRAVRAVAGHGATVRVRTYTTVAGGDLDAAVAAQVRRCASWRDGQGQRRPDLLVLAVSLQDRRTGLYYGSGWQDALDDEQEAIQTDTVNPLLQRKQYAQAVRAGLVAVERLLPEGPAEVPVADDEGSAGGETDDAVPIDNHDEMATHVSQPFGEPFDVMIPIIGVGILAVFGSVLVGVLRASGGGGGGVRRRRSGSWNSMDGADHGYTSGTSRSFFGSSAAGSSSGFSSGFSSGSSSSGGSSGSDGGSSSSSGGGGGSTSW